MKYVHIYCISCITHTRHVHTLYVHTLHYNNTSHVQVECVCVYKCESKHVLRIERKIGAANSYSVWASAGMIGQGAQYESITPYTSQWGWPSLGTWLDTSDSWQNRLELLREPCSINKHPNWECRHRARRRHAIEGLNGRDRDTSHIKCYINSPFLRVWYQVKKTLKSCANTLYHARERGKAWAS